MNRLYYALYRLWSIYKRVCVEGCLVFTNHLKFSPLFILIKMFADFLK